ncbi:hypothetical protein KIN20_007474 [Parelaphostrongylus tenuis]|uniref:Uncharacterized protein n=1 Tax=Parelaphostrongylus tenuis TaxID=148309 RepID=A0AAD5M3H0_PARTN|nr:hypothetical protein KIN20_007474 [Parelaphostrongylus tenuis]
MKGCSLGFMHCDFLGSNSCKIYGVFNLERLDRSRSYNWRELTWWRSKRRSSNIKKCLPMWLRIMIGVLSEKGEEASWTTDMQQEIEFLSGGQGL